MLIRTEGKTDRAIYFASVKRISSSFHSPFSQKKLPGSAAFSVQSGHSESAVATFLEFC